MMIDRVTISVDILHSGRDRSSDYSMFMEPCYCYRN